MIPNNLESVGGIDCKRNARAAHATPDDVKYLGVPWHLGPRTIRNSSLSAFTMSFSSLQSRQSMHSAKRHCYVPGSYTQAVML